MTIPSTSKLFIMALTGAVPSFASAAAGSSPANSASQPTASSYGWSYVESRPSSTAKPYAGPYKLAWGKVGEYGDGLQEVQVKKGHTVVPWPKSVPVYGEPSMVSDSGDVDNRILGQSGDWLWIAMKGPKNPPISLPVEYLFREWNRVLALNVVNGSFRVFHMPARTSPVPTAGTTPGFTTRKGKVYINSGDWVGVFPANSNKISTDKIGIVCPEPAADFKLNQTIALTELAAATRQEAGNIAYQWDHDVMNKSVPGVTGSDFGWMSDGAYINHGYVPDGVIFGSEFPYKPGSAAVAERNILVQQLETINRNPLTSAMYALDTPAKEKHAFHGVPPKALPGYQIQQGLYIPSPSAWKLPSAFHSYAAVFASFGPLLAQKSPYAVWLPAPTSNPEVRSGEWTDVAYTVNQMGFDLAVSSGSHLPANSKDIIGGNANLLFSLHVQSANKPLGPDYAWDMSVAIPEAKVTHIQLGDGFIGTVYTKGTGPQAQQSVSWKENGWSFGVSAAPASEQPIGQAKQEAAALKTEQMPVSSGEGVFGIGSGAPSQVQFQWLGGLYVLYASGWRAPAVASTMVDLSAY